MGDKEEAENDRRKLMNKIFCSALTAVVAGAMLTGCAMPWEKGADDDVAPGGYSYTADSNSEQKQAYRWLIEPTINADNIISFDGSQVDPNNEKNTAYANYSVIRQNGKYGIIDYSGNMVVPAEYDDYYTCWCGEVTLFNIINEKNDEYEYCSIDSSNQVVYYAAEHHDSSPKYYWNSNEEKIYVKDADEEQGEEYTGKKAVVVCEADEFFDVLREEPLDNWYEIGSVITIADACLDTNLSEASDYLLASQLSEAGIVLMSRCQEVTKQELEDTLKHLEAVQKKFHCHRMTKPEIIMKDWSELTDEDMERIANSGYEPDSHEKLWFDQDKAYTSLYFMNMKLPDNAMEDAVSRLMSDSKCGRIFRVKGFMQNAEGKWLELNATHKNITVKPIERGQAVFIVIGEGLDKEHIDGYFVPV